jgi:hypothetical protein
LKIHDRDIEAGCPGQLFSLQWIFNAIGRTWKMPTHPR